MIDVVWAPAPWLSEVSLALAVIGVGTALFAWRRVGRLNRRLGGFLPADASRTRDIADALSALGDRIRDLEKEVSALRKADGDVAAQLSSRLRTPGVIRFNAFTDMGSDMSYAVALVDEAGDGVVLSAIQGREGSRVYAKPVKAGRSPYPLTPEELRALAAAGMEAVREN